VTEQQRAPGLAEPRGVLPEPGGAFDHRVPVGEPADGQAHRKPALVSRRYVTGDLLERAFGASEPCKQRAPGNGGGVSMAGDLARCAAGGVQCLGDRARVGILGECGGDLGVRT
jgi:hypothetical protein